MDPIVTGVAVAFLVLAASLWFFVINPAPARVRSPKDPYSVEVSKDSDGNGIRRHANFKSSLITAPVRGRTIYDVFQRSVKDYADNNCFGVRPVIKIHEEKKMVDGAERVMTFPELGPFEWMTYKQAGEKVKRLADGFAALGMKKGDFLAIFEDTRLEWTLASRACYCHSLVVFTVYANLGEEALVYALEQGEIGYMLTNATLLPLVAKIASSVKALKNIIYVGGKAEEQDLATLRSKGVRVISFDEVEKLGEAHPISDNPPSLDDLACIMYTSGSTGKPKGVMISHRNLSSALGGMEKIIEVKSNDFYLNYLPLAHIFAFVCEAIFLSAGASLGYGSPRTLAATGVRKCEGDIKELRPTILLAVPTIYERLKQGVLARIAKSGFITQTIFNLAFKARLNALRNGSDTPFWNKLVFNKIRDNVGGRLRIMASGSAPLSPDVHDFLRVCLGCPLIQGYGLTETTSSGAAQWLTDMQTGRIGSPFPSMEIKLVDVPDMGYRTVDNPPCGEVWLRGATITQGYYKEPKLTQESFVNGWFATGDIGMLHSDGSFAIIDRKKNLIKPPHGEYIALEKLEATYRNSAFVETILVFVDSFHHDCVCIVVPNRDPLIEWASKNPDIKTPLNDFAALCADALVVKHVLSDLQATGRKLKLKSIETVRALHLLPEQWTPQNLYLTAAMKLNRNFVVSQNRHIIDAMYEKLSH